MAAATLEERVAALEAEVARLKARLGEPDSRAIPWWEKIAGTFEGDPYYEEAMLLPCISAWSDIARRCVVPKVDLIEAMFICAQVFPAVVAPTTFSRLPGSTARAKNASPASWGDAAAVGSLTQEAPPSSLRIGPMPR